MQFFQVANKRGQAKHKMAPIRYRNALKDKKIKKKEVPFMVRGGPWDDNDVHRAKRAPWLKSDKKYANEGCKTEQCATILRGGPSSS